jgi:hypothetical protein
MENEGIMALPMPGPEERGSRAERPTVTSTDSYDAALTALGMANPDALAGLQGELGQSLAGIEIAPEELSLIIQMFEELINNPRRYKELRSQIIQQGVVDAADLPEEYDLELLSTILAVLNELKLSQIRGAQAPMAMSPVMQEPAPPPMQMAEGGLADMAQYLASKGRRGDTMLAHITPEEAEMLKRMGGSGTINPETGLPEFFKKFFQKVFGGVVDAVKSVVNVAKKVLENPVGRVLATVGLAMVLGPTALGATLGSAGTAALSAGAVTLAGGGSMKDALISGALGYIGGGGDFGGLGSPLKGVSQFLSPIVAPGTALSTGLSTGLLGTGAGLALGMKPGEALRSGAMAGLTAGALQGLQGPQQPAGATPQDAAAAQPAGAEGAVPASPTASAVTGAGAPGATGPIGTVGTAADLGPPGGSTFQPGVGFSEYAASGAAPPKPGFFDNLGQSLSNTFSPNRPGLSPDAGFFTRYGPLMAAGVGAATLAGGMQKTPGDPEPLYKTSAFEQESLARMRARQQDLEQAGYGLTRGMSEAAPRSPVLVPTPSYAQMERSPVPTVTPTGITNMPGGVAQPYNVAGLYGIPLLYGQQPAQRARGGEMKMTEFPRKTGPINGPGTGTSDSIPAMLSDGEFVFTAKAVRNAGNGSRRKGAARMYKLMKALEGGAVKA